MKLTIGRNIWLRGEGADKSSLLRKEDQKMCCVGIYLRNLGVPVEKLTGCNSATSLHYIHGGGLECVPEEARWLVKKDELSDNISTPKEALELYRANDSILECSEHDNEPLFYTEGDRESAIERLFASHGVEVEFSD
jgi:hypothetical protein